MTFPFARRTFWRSLLPEHRPFVALTATFGALIVVIAGLVAGGTGESYTNLTSQSALTLVSVTSAAPGGAKPVTEKSMTAFAAMPGVVGVHPWAQVGLMSSSEMTPEGTFPVVFWATAQVPYIQPGLLATGRRPDLEKGQIILPSSAGDLSLLRFSGRDVLFNFQVKTGADTVTNAQTRLRVVGFYDSKGGGADGPGAAYVSSADALHGRPPCQDSPCPSFGKHGSRGCTCRPRTWLRWNP